MSDPLPKEVLELLMNKIVKCYKQEETIRKQRLEIWKLKSAIHTLAKKRNK